VQWLRRVAAVALEDSGALAGAPPALADTTTDLGDEGSVAEAATSAAAASAAREAARLAAEAHLDHLSRCLLDDADGRWAVPLRLPVIGQAAAEGDGGGGRGATISAKARRAAAAALG